MHARGKQFATLIRRMNDTYACKSTIYPLVDTHCKHVTDIGERLCTLFAKVRECSKLDNYLSTPLTEKGSEMSELCDSFAIQRRQKEASANK